MAEISDHIEHVLDRFIDIILSHHGKLEHGSPVVPCTREATLVHFIDNLGGNSDLISIRGRQSFFRPFTRVDELRRHRRPPRVIRARLHEHEQLLAGITRRRGEALPRKEHQREARLIGHPDRQVGDLGVVSECRLPAALVLTEVGVVDGAERRGFDRALALDIERGESISAALGKHPVFPSMIIRMITAGEQTGKIDNMLERISDFLDEEIETTLAGLTSLIEPILIIFLGVVIGGMVICMFLPIFKMAEIISSK